MNTQIKSKQDSPRCNRVSKTEATKPVRVSLQTKKSLDTMVKTIHNKKTGKRLKYDDIIACAIAKLTDSDIDNLRNSMISNKDRFEELDRTQRKTNKLLTKDELLGLLLEGSSVDNESSPIRLFKDGAFFICSHK